MPFLDNQPVLKPFRRELRRNQTDVERLLWRHLRGRNFVGLKFYRQYSIGSYVLDFYCPERRLAVELDGGQHSEGVQRSHDENRTTFLAKQGIRVLRFWNNEVLQNTDGVLETIRRAVE